MKGVIIGFVAAFLLVGFFMAGMFYQEETEGPLEKTAEKIDDAAEALKE
jgi:hypothetical protein